MAEDLENKELQQCDESLRPEEVEPADTRIYLLPNLMTAGNLLCGFGAVLKIFEGASLRRMGEESWVESIEMALFLILGACIFDVLDGRLARLGGKDSLFGREFDSLADVVSFGVAPALLVYHIVLYEFPMRLGWLVASFYLLCGALRLARFNSYASSIQGTESAKEFKGFPIPAAAGLIASIVMVMLAFYEKGSAFVEGWWRYCLVLLLVLLSFMMFSKMRYPSFKGLGWGTKPKLTWFIAIVLGVVLLVFFFPWAVAIVFLLYFVYGFIRPLLSLGMRREIEQGEWDAENDQNPRQ
ncbi:MAG: CDP-diacylglycerol--serine O-phosphatidyltransferase [Methylacidiphilales bacterium]|nr:CDP-diacylglycerol--serine O-phosphatidyltransferase [Candidatus Methylacidiphilales bacterium]MDW8350059.1 CDP-diacylglycerol--serine O-phosphatidyltransferase [Verrucomicrobiae bacterium]